MILYLQILGLVFITILFLAFVLMIIGGTIKMLKEENKQNDKIDQLCGDTLEANGRE